MSFRNLNCQARKTGNAQSIDSAFLPTTIQKPTGITGAISTRRLRIGSMKRTVSLLCHLPFSMRPVVAHYKQMPTSVMTPSTASITQGLASPNWCGRNRSNSSFGPPVSLGVHRLWSACTSTITGGAHQRLSNWQQALAFQPIQSNQRGTVSFASYKGSEQRS